MVYGVRQRNKQTKMAIEKSWLVLALLLINKDRGLNNSYKLMRILEWGFRVSDSKKILDEIKVGHYAEYEIINGIHYYTLTQEGAKFIGQEYDMALNSLLIKYPERMDVISSLFESFPLVKE